MNSFEEIEQYLSGDMDVSARQSFEKRLEADPDLYKALQDWIRTDAILQKHRAAEKNLPALKKILQPLTTQYFSSAKSAIAESERKTAAVIPFRKYIIAAASVAAILIFYFLMPASIDEYEINPIPNVVMRGSTDQTQTGAKLFNTGEFATALPYLKDKALKNPEDATSQYYYGICLLKTNDYKSAYQVFDILSKGESAFKEDSHFFAALSAYHLDDQQAALTHAQRVPESNQYYKNAKKVIKKLQ